MKKLWLIILTLMFIPACRYEPPRTGRLGTEPFVARRADETTSVYASLDAPVAAGTERFFFGDGTGMNCTLDLASDQTFRFRWVGCLGEYGRNHGGFVLDGGKLTLVPREPNPSGFGGMDTTYTVVTWGDRKYLVPVDQFIEFCNDVNAGTEPRDSSFGGHYLREGDELKQVDGRPHVPSSWKTFLLDHPVSARVSQVDPVKKTCILDAGANSGLRVGMTLLAPDSREFSMLEIVETTAASATAKSKYNDPLPIVGERYLTRWYTTNGNS